MPDQQALREQRAVRDLDSAFAGMLSSAYVALRRAGLSPEMARGELLGRLNRRLNTLHAQGVPPAWERDVSDG